MPTATRRRPRLVLLVAALSALISAATCVVAVLVPAPAVALPLIVAVCVGCPVFAGWEAPFAVAALRAERTGGEALTMLRRSLAQLPEIEHPLGL